LEVPERINDVRFSNRPFRVKRFQTIHHYSVDVAHGLVLLYGIGTKALPSWDSKTGWNNLSGGLVVFGTNGSDDLLGTSADDDIRGFGGNDVLYGLGGNDSLDGGSGADAMAGGKGNDTYFVDDHGDVA